LKFWVGVTDSSWFNFLSELKPDEVNFWQPGGSSTFRAIDPGGLFLFKLHSPLNYIAGGGFFIRHSVLPLSLAWEAFEKKNGAEEFGPFRSKIMNLRKQYRQPEPDPLIGCIILAEPFFFDRKDWITAPRDWKPNIVQGRSYDTSEPIGLELWKTVEERLAAHKINYEVGERTMEVAEETARYGEYLSHGRLGQGAFRILVTEAYKRRCTITGERTLPVLEAAHIKPYSVSGPHRINNGLLLRSDLHKLFDLGYMTITTDLHVEVSRRIKEDYENGREYYALHGKKLMSLPSVSEDKPSNDYIAWHNQNIYMG
jgi:putative restriction endonuclease